MGDVLIETGNGYIMEGTDGELFEADTVNVNYNVYSVVCDKLEDGFDVEGL